MQDLSCKIVAQKNPNARGLMNFDTLMLGPGLIYFVKHNKQTLGTTIWPFTITSPNLNIRACKWPVPSNRSCHCRYFGLFLIAITDSVRSKLLNIEKTYWWKLQTGHLTFIRAGRGSAWEYCISGGKIGIFLNSKEKPGPWLFHFSSESDKIKYIMLHKVLHKVIYHCYLSSL